MNIDIKKELETHRTILFQMTGKEYNDIVENTVKDLSGDSICYVTINKTYKALKENFEEAGINTDNIIFLDAISGSIKETPTDKENIKFVDSPSSFTDLSLAISDLLKGDAKYLIFDSITNLLTYRDKETVEKFLSNIVNKVRGSDTRAVFYALQTSSQEELISKTSMFVDKALDTKDIEEE